MNEIECLFAVAHGSYSFTCIVYAECRAKEGQCNAACVVLLASHWWQPAPAYQNDSTLKTYCQ